MPLTGILTILALLFPAPAIAQDRPEFSGRWRVDRSQSTLTRKLAGGRVAGVAPAFGDECTIQQNAETISIDHGSKAGPTIYRLDGSATQFHEAILRATWEGQKLRLVFSGPARGAGDRVIEAETTRVLHLSKPDVLVVETTDTPSTGPLPVAVTVYSRIK